MIPPHIKIKNGDLPDHPGVYLYYDQRGLLLYVGKATSLKRRVGSYFTKAHDNRIAEMVTQIERIDYIETPTVIEALVLEANRIKALRPKYNILQRDDKTYLYLVITRAAFPKPLLMRGLDLERIGVNPFAKRLEGEARKKFLAVFGPYTSGSSLRKALDLIRKAIPWSICDAPEETGRIKPCFNSSIGKCPGVCSGHISKKEYRNIIRQLILFFEGKKSQLLRQMKKEMDQASTAMDFEKAARLRNSLGALEHIKDVALITREESLPYLKPEGTYIDLNGRIEAYDISNISGTSAVGSMVVFENGKPNKSLYRKFKIKTVEGSNDFAMMEEVMRRRLKHVEWEYPQVMVIDGGEGQVAVVEKVMEEFAEGANVQTSDSSVPFGPFAPLAIVGIAKGFDRKQDRLVYDMSNQDLARVVVAGKELFQRARDEAHRFAVSYHRVLRSKRSLGLSDLKRSPPSGKLSP